MPDPAPLRLPDRRKAGLVLVGGVLLCIAAIAVFRLGTEAPLGTSLRSIREFPGRPTALTFSADGKLLAIASEDRVVHLHETATGEHKRSFPAALLPVGALTLSPDGKLLATVGTAGVQPGHFEFKLWNIVDGTAVHEVLDEGHTSFDDGCSPLPFVAFSPDNSLVATGGRNRTINVWDVKQRRIKVSWKAAGVPSAVAFSPDGTAVAEATHTGEIAGTVAVYDVQTGALKRNIWGLYSGALQVVFSRDGRELAAAFRHAFAKREISGNSDNHGEGKIHWNWEPESPKRVAKSAAFSDGGRLLAVITGETRINASAELEWIGRPRLFVRDTESGRELPEIEGVEGPVAMSPNGKLLATGGDRTILWRVE